jgi:hypothetical protein
MSSELAKQQFGANAVETEQQDLGIAPIPTDDDIANVEGGVLYIPERPKLIF